MMRNVISGVKIGINVLIGFVVVLIFIAPLFRIYPNVVMSGSMEPEIPVGSIAFVNEKVSAKEIQENDVIAFELEGGTRILHRVVKKNDAETNFRTKGDANKTEDIGLVKFEQYKGKYLFCLPYLGYIVKFFCNTYIWVIGISGCVAFLAVDIVCERREKKSYE